MLQKNAVETRTLGILENLQSQTLLKDFSLAGGTSLALQIGHRKSIDLDLFSLNDFDVQQISEFLEQRFNFKIDFTSFNTLKGTIDEVRIEFITHKYDLVKPFIEQEKIRLYSVEDISAMKLNAIAMNGTRLKDFIDIYFILKQFSFSEIINFYMKKYKTRNLLHVVKSLTYFDEVNANEILQMLKEKDLTFSKIKTFIRKEVVNYSKANL